MHNCWSWSTATPLLLSVGRNNWKVNVSHWRVWRYQKGNQNLYIEEEQTTQWPKVQKFKSTNNDLQNITHKTATLFVFVFSRTVLCSTCTRISTKYGLPSPSLRLLQMYKNKNFIVQRRQKQTMLLLLLVRHLVPNKMHLKYQVFKQPGFCHYQDLIRWRYDLIFKSNDHAMAAMTAQPF
jgi:hypothetical protein